MVFKCFLVPLAIVALTIQSVVVQRVSDTKCEEYSRIPRDGDSKIAHMVFIREQHDSYLKLGVLISDKFVLTSALAVESIALFESQVYFSNDEHYNIAERYIHPDFTDMYSNNVALLRLEIKIVLDSRHRPACLWTKDHYDSSYAEILHNCNECGHYATRSLKLLTRDECSTQLQGFASNASSHICVQRQNSADNSFDSTKGSPIQEYRPKEDLPDNYYIYGLVSYYLSNSDPYITVGIKTYIDLDWIESIVWRVNKPFLEG